MNFRFKSISAQLLEQSTQLTRTTGFTNQLNQRAVSIGGQLALLHKLTNQLAGPSRFQ